MQTRFEIEGDYIELIKLLKLTGLCESGGRAKMVVADGQVTVDGAVELRKKCKLRRNQVVEFKDHRIQLV